MPNAYLSRTFGGLKITVPPVWLVVVLPLAFFGAAVASQAAFGTADTPIWVSNAFAVTALLRNKRACWPVLLLLAFIADFSASALTSPHLLALGIATCDSCEILLVATLAELTGAAALDGGIGPMVRLALICLAVPVLSSTAGAGLLVAFYGGPFAASWLIWYLDVTCGLLIVTPFLLSWTDQSLRKQLLRGTVAQTVVLAGGVALVGFLDFHDKLPGLFLAFPVLLFATFNGRLLGATTATVALAAVAIWSTLKGSGPIAAFSHTDTVQAIQILQVYIVIILLSSLPVALILEQREKLTAQLRETQEDLARVNRAMVLSELTSSIAHEVRQPLAGIAASAGAATRWLATDPPHVDEANTSLERIVRDSQRASEIISRVSALTTREPPHKDLLNVNATILEVIAMADDALQRNHVVLQTGLSPGLPEVTADRVQVQQVILNLITNAIEAMKEKTDGRRELTVNSGWDDENHLFVEVRDTGAGLDPDHTDKLFEAFHTTKPGGMGLGLAISRSIVKAHDGRIWAAPNQPCGAVLRFTLPARRDIA